MDEGWELILAPTVLAHSLLHSNLASRHRWSAYSPFPAQGRQAKPADQQGFQHLPRARSSSSMPAPKCHEKDILKANGGCQLQGARTWAFSMPSMGARSRHSSTITTSGRTRRIRAATSRQDASLAWAVPST